MEEISITLLIFAGLFSLSIYDIDIFAMIKHIIINNNIKFCLTQAFFYCFLHRLSIVRVCGAQNFSDSKFQGIKTSSSS